MKTYLLVATTLGMMAACDKASPNDPLYVGDRLQFDTRTVMAADAEAEDNPVRYRVTWENMGSLIITNAEHIMIFPPNVMFEDEEGRRWHAEWVRE